MALCGSSKIRAVPCPISLRRGIGTRSFSRFDASITCLTAVRPTGPLSVTTINNCDQDIKEKVTKTCEEKQKPKPGK